MPHLAEAVGGHRRAGAARRSEPHLAHHFLCRLHAGVLGSPLSKTIPNSKEAHTTLPKTQLFYPPPQKKRQARTCLARRTGELGLDRSEKFFVGLTMPGICMPLGAWIIPGKPCEPCPYAAAAGAAAGRKADVWGPMMTGAWL